MDNFVDVLADLVIGDSPVIIDEDGNETDVLIDIVSENESKHREKDSKKKSSDATKNIDGQTYKLDFSGCLKNLDTNRRTRQSKEKPRDKPVVAISSEESDASGPITRLKPLNKRKTRAIRSSSDESDLVPEPSTDSIPEIKLKGISNKGRTNRKIITIPDEDKLKDDEIQIVDSPVSMETEFDSREVIIDGKSSRKPVIASKPKRNSASRRITDKTMDQEYVEPKLPRFKKKKPQKKVEDVVDQLVIPPIEIPSPDIQEIIPDEPTASKSNSKSNVKMGCLETLEKMEESSDDILQGWGSENSQPELFASSSRTNRLDGPSRSKRLSKDLQSAPKRPRSHPVDPFRKSIISPDKNPYKTDAFVSKISNKVRFDGGRHPKQRTRTEKENYERRHSASTFRTRDSSPNAIIEIHSSMEKKSNRNQTEQSRSRNTNVLQLSSDSE